jgi:inosine-uridine nucleoside N-ribohydrolase
MTGPRVIVDCDPGHDDAVAILVAHRFWGLVTLSWVSEPA